MKKYQSHLGSVLTCLFLALPQALEASEPLEGSFTKGENCPVGTSEVEVELAGSVFKDELKQEIEDIVQRFIGGTLEDRREHQYVRRLQYKVCPQVDVAREKIRRRPNTSAFCLAAARCVEMVLSGTDFCITAIKLVNQVALALCPEDWRQKGASLPNS